MIHLDANFLIRGVVVGTSQQAAWARWVVGRTPVRVSAPAWAEFLCGPVAASDRAEAARLLGSPVELGGTEAEIAAELFNLGGRRRGSMMDCMIAAVAIANGADLATANTADFARFVPRGLRLRAP